MTLPVRARFGASTMPLMTTDVAADGVFLSSPRTPALHELVHLTLFLPGSGPLEVRAMVVRMVTGEMAWQRGAPAGVGVKFYGLGEEARRRWQSFFEAAGGTRLAPAPAEPPPPAREEPPARSSAEAAAPVPRPQPRSEPAPKPPPRPAKEGAAQSAPVPAETLGPPLLLYRIRPRDVEGVRFFGDTALESGGLALVGAPPGPPKALVVVAVVHPVTKAEFHIPAKMARRKGLPDAPALRLLGVTAHTKAEFDYFARHGQPRTGATEAKGRRDRSLTESFEETQQDLDLDGEHVATVEVAPLDATSGRTSKSGG